MLSEDVRARLAMLHRPLTLGPAPLAPGATPISSPLAPAVNLFEQAQPCENSSGVHLRFRRPLAAIWSGLERTTGEERRAWPAPPAHPELAAVADHFPQGTLFLDLETCGFAGSSVFLAGLVWQVDGVLVVDQLFARNYAEERAVLETLWRVAARNRVLVTFNGKSFDWPMVHDRSTRHHLGRDARGQCAEPTPGAPAAGLTGLGRHDARPELTHCDLLHHARRRWKRRLPDCKLQTLERHVCHRRRHDDLGGALVPLAYHQYVRSGDTRPINAILHHNALDLATLVELTVVLLGT